MWYSSVSVFQLISYLWLYLLQYVTVWEVQHGVYKFFPPHACLHMCIFDGGMSRRVGVLGGERRKQVACHSCIFSVPEDISVNTTTIGTTKTLSQQSGYIQTCEILVSSIPGYHERLLRWLHAFKLKKFTSKHEAPAGAAVGWGLECGVTVVMSNVQHKNWHIKTKVNQLFTSSILYLLQMRLPVCCFSLTSC